MEEYRVKMIQKMIMEADMSLLWQILRSEVIPISTLTMTN